MLLQLHWTYLIENEMIEWKFRKLLQQNKKEKRDVKNQRKKPQKITLWFFYYFLELIRFCPILQVWIA